MRIHILALSGVFDTGLAAVPDAVGTANAQTPDAMVMPAILPMRPLKFALGEAFQFN